MNALSFTEFYEAERSRLLGFCMARTRDRRDAEDVASEVWARAWRSREFIRHKGWLYTVATRVMIDWSEKWGRQITCDVPERANEGWESQIDTEQQVAQIIASLPERERELTRLWMDGESHVEIAAALGMTPQAARQAWVRSMKRMRSNADPAN